MKRLRDRIRLRGNLSEWDRKNLQFLEKTIEEGERKIATGECKENKNNQIVDDKVSKSDNNHEITSCLLYTSVFPV